MGAPRRTFFSMTPARLLGFAILFFTGWIAGVVAQQVPSGVRVGKGFSVPYHEGTVLKALFTGQDAKPLPGGKILVTQFGLKTFRDGDKDKVEMIVEAPECVFDRNSYTASSAGTLRVSTPATNFVIVGEGFLCQQTNSLLLISNNVQTILRKGSGRLPTPGPPAGPEPEPAGESRRPEKSDTVTIDSDHFLFLYASNHVTYSGSVQVQDPEMSLASELLEIQFTTNNTVETILAETNVLIGLKQHESRARGQRAVYTISAEEELVELTGNPTWQDLERESRADLFIFDRRNNQVHARTNAWIKLPQNPIGRPDLLATDTTKQEPAANGQVTELFAERFTIQLPETNGPIQRITAHNNVVILASESGSRATASQAVYSEASGLLVLTGNSRWHLNEQEIRAEILSVARETRTLTGRGNVHLRIPARHLGKHLAVKPNTDDDPSGSEFIDLFADDFDYEDQVATFRENVRADYLEVDGLLTTLLCGLLKLTFNSSNQVEHAIASEQVFVQQKPPPDGTTPLVSKSLSSQRLEAERAPGGAFRRIKAEEAVTIEQIERSPSGDLVYKRLSSEILRFLFSPSTNRVERVVAEKNVRAEQIEHLAAGEKGSQAAGETLDYLLTPGEEKVELTGNPVARTAGVVISDADVLIWDPQTGKLRARGPYKITPQKGPGGFRISTPRKQPSSK
jgi:lipopolysaccharide export system protein LptA